MSSKTLVLLLLLLAGTEFVLRGPARWIGRGNDRVTDLTGPYLGARAWVRGENPYSPAVFWDEADRAGWHLRPADRLDGFESRTPYPLTTFVLLSPLAPLPWSIARIVASLCMSALLVSAIFALVSVAALPRPSERRYLFLALALGFAPVSSSIGAGNPVAAAVALTILAIWAALGGRDALAGLMLALAICLKPPIAAFAVCYYVLRPRWRLTAVAAGTVAAVGAIGVLRLWAAGAPWLADYLYNNGQLLADHGGAIIVWTPAQQQFINLQYLGYLMFKDTATAALLAMAVSGSLALIWLLLLWRDGGRSGLLALSALAIISLLPIYHRVYDAALLLLPLAWCLRNAASARWQRPATFVLLLPFLVPGSTFLEMQVAAGRVPSWVTTQWWWSDVVIPHQVWLLLALAVVLLTAMASAGDDTGSVREQAA